MKMADSEGQQHQCIEEEARVLEMIPCVFYSKIELLESSQYFNYPDVTNEIEKVKTEIKSHFPNYFGSEENTVLADILIDKFSTFMLDKSVENKERREEIQNKINSTFDSMRKSEFQTLKSMAEKASPEPIEWKPDCEKLYNDHFDSLVKSIASSTSPGYDQEFQKECRETSWKKTESVCKATKFSSSFINEYSQNMALELEKNICFPLESDFTQVHENTIIVIYNKINSQETVVKKFETVWTRLDDLTKATVIEYEKKFRLENQEIRKEEAEIAENAKDIALTKYNNFMNNETSQGSGIFTRSEILNFHNEAYYKVKTYFYGIPGFKYTFSWEKTWEKLDKELKELEKSYLDKNQQKIKENNLQRLKSMAAAENEYRRLMNNSISRASHGKSIEQKELERFHANGAKKALELNGKKMEGIQGDVKKYKETLISNFLEIRKQLVSENDEKIARELQKKEEREVKQREQEEQRKKERKSQIQQQKSQPKDISKISIQNSPCNSNQINSNASSSSKFKCGICLHLSTTKSNLKLHMIKHQHQKDFKCHLCGNDFKRKNDLQQHIQSHLPEKSYKCPKQGCDYAAKRSTHLSTHMKTHSLDKNHACPYPNCDYRTAVPQDLTRHLKIHYPPKFNCKCDRFSSHQSYKFKVHLEKCKDQAATETPGKVSKRKGEGFESRKMQAQPKKHCFRKSKEPRKNALSKIRDKRCKKQSGGSEGQRDIAQSKSQDETSESTSVEEPGRSGQSSHSSIAENLLKMGAEEFISYVQSHVGENWEVEMGFSQGSVLKMLAGDNAMEFKALLIKKLTQE